MSEDFKWWEEDTLKISLDKELVIIRFLSSEEENISSKWEEKELTSENKDSDNWELEIT